jgi:hypothetical protein
MLSQSKLGEVRHLVAFLRIAAERFRPVQVANSIKCPYCSRDIPCHWEPLYTLTRNNDTQEGIELRDEDGRPYEKYDIHWMQCFSDDCAQVIVRVRKTALNRNLDPLSFEEWLAVPRKRALRPIDPFVPEEFSKPYVRASLILEDAPDMSGVLSRRILQDLLEKYAGRSEYKLEERIDKFIEESAAPSHVKDNLHHLREIGNFAAHTKANKETGEIVEVGSREAEWTLNVIDDLFDYFIVGPEKSRKRRLAWDLKRGPQNPVAKKNAHSS